jgi:predicted  nucleic acid-binding Zn-ribbon protein
MNRTKGILAAGTLTGLVLITILALGFGNLQAKSADDTAVAPAAAEVSLPQTNGLTTEEALQAWQDYSVQLEQTVQTMQGRDAAYQQQLDAANQTIIQLQDQINSANSAPASSFFGEHEEHEHEEHEHEFGEHDD